MCKSEALERGNAVLCFFWAFYNTLIGEVLDKRGSDPCPVDVNRELDPVRRIAVREVMLQVQSDVEFGTSNRFYECGCAQVTVFGCVLGEWRAVHADGDRSTGKTIGVHGGSGAVWMYAVRAGVIARVVLVGEVEIMSEAERPSGSF